MKITVEKNVVVKLKSVTLTLSPEQAAVVMYLVGATNLRQKQELVFDHDNELVAPVLKTLDINFTRGSVSGPLGTSVGCVDEVYGELARVFRDAAAGKN